MVIFRFRVCEVLARMVPSLRCLGVSRVAGLGLPLHPVLLPASLLTDLAKATLFNGTFAMDCEGPCGNAVTQTALTIRFY